MFIGKLLATALAEFPTKTYTMYTTRTATFPVMIVERTRASRQPGHHIFPGDRCSVSTKMSRDFHSSCGECTKSKKLSSTE